MHRQILPAADLDVFYLVFLDCEPTLCRRLNGAIVSLGSEAGCLWLCPQRYVRAWGWAATREELAMFFALGRTRDDRGAEEMIGHCAFASLLPLTIFHLIAGFRMSAPVRLYATRSSVTPALTLYTALAEDLAAEASGSTPAPRRSKRIKAEDNGEVSPTNSFAGNTRVATPKSRRSAKRVKVEHATDANAEDEAALPKRRTESSHSRPPKKQKAVQQSLDNPHPAPEHWKEQYDTIKSMRARLTAPVDTMGCDQAQNGETDPKVCISCRKLYPKR